MHSHSVIILLLMLAFCRYCIGSGMPYNGGFRILESSEQLPYNYPTEPTEFRPYIIESSAPPPPIVDKALERAQKKAKKEEAKAKEKRANDEIKRAKDEEKRAKNEIKRAKDEEKRAKKEKKASSSKAKKPRE
uniref:Uncharacterized protein n=1 Tax=Globodera rostochiensis TaxID=31243 RepID=A0A914H856_GLORO